MPRTKPINAKKKVKHAEVDQTEETSDSEPLPAGKIKKIAEVDIHEDVIGVIEEKVEVDPLLAEEETDETTAEEALDDDEVNPFGDKWEV